MNSHKKCSKVLVAFAAWAVGMCALACDPGHGVISDGELSADPGSRVDCVQAALRDAAFVRNVRVMGSGGEPFNTFREGRAAVLTGVDVVAAIEGGSAVYSEGAGYRWFRLSWSMDGMPNASKQEAGVVMLERVFDAIAARCPGFPEKENLHNEVW